MSEAALVSVEGIIARSGESLLSSPLLPTGLMLVNALAHNYKIILSSTIADVAEMSLWLQGQGIMRLPMDIFGRESGDHSRQVSFARRTYGIGLVLSPSPADVKDSIEAGVMSLLFADPAYARPEFRPSTPRGIKAWADLEGRVQADLVTREAQELASGVTGDAFDRGDR